MDATPIKYPHLREWQGQRPSNGPPPFRFPSCRTRNSVGAPLRLSVCRQSRGYCTMPRAGAGTDPGVHCIRPCHGCISRAPRVGALLFYQVMLAARNRILLRRLYPTPPVPYGPASGPAEGSRAHGALAHGARRSTRHAEAGVSRLYTNRSCRRLGWPAQNSTSLSVSMFY